MIEEAYTLDEVAPLFGCASAKALQRKASKGQLPFPLTDFSGGLAKKPNYVVLKAHVRKAVENTNDKTWQQFEKDQAALKHMQKSEVG